MMKKQAVLVIAAFTAACADPVTGPTRLLSNDVALAVTDTLYKGVDGPAGINSGEVELCKTTIGGGATFTFSVTVNGVETPANESITLAGAGTACYPVPVHTANFGNEVAPDVVVITEGANPTSQWALTAINTRRYLAEGLYNGGGYTAPRLSDVEDVPNRKATVYINGDMARRVTFTNTFTPTQTTGCTYTKGWYQNKNGAPTVIGVDGRTKSEAQQIFAATPGKPGNVTFSGINSLLNLYQQLLAALNNLGGDLKEHDGPPALDAAIDAAKLGTGGSGLAITTNLTQTQIGALTSTLASFNEGGMTGWPHCP